jgi:hypothetical protein
MATRVFPVKFHISWYIILLLTAWWIYLADHLLDGIDGGAHSSNPRHHFFYRNRKILMVVLFFIAAMDACLIWMFLPARLIWTGLVLGGLVMGYLWVIQNTGPVPYKVFPKECIVGLLYTAGIWGMPIFLEREEWQVHYLMPVVGFYGIVVINLFLYAWFEKDTDRADHQKSLVVSFGPRRALVIIMVWMVGTWIWNLVFLTIYFSYPVMRSCGIILVSMQGVQYLIFRYRNAKWIQTNYRWINESVFFLPALMALV